MRFQEDTARNLFRMQILAPDGTPIESLEQLTRLQLSHNTPPPTQQRLPIEGTLNGSQNGSRDGSQQSAPQQAPPPTVPTRAPSTTIDALEREFQRNKQRDLAAAKQAGGSATAVATQRRTGETIGRNDPCFCGSGKKYKKCHGAAA
jgi:preprotein translocase subunit SecA